MSIKAQTAALATVQQRVAAETARLQALRAKLTEYRAIANAKYVSVGGSFGTEPRVVIRFDGYESTDPEGRLTRIAGTPLHALLSAWLDGEFAALAKQEEALANRDLVAEVTAILSALAKEPA